MGSPMFIGYRSFLHGFFLLVAIPGLAQQPASTVDVPLIVPAGTPLRVRTEGTTFPKRLGDVVHGRLTQPVFAFDRDVLPAGTEAIGQIVSFSKPSRMQEFGSILGGHFGSFRKPEVQFDTLQAGSAPRSILTDTAPGNGQTVEMRAETKSKHGIVGSAVARGKQEVNMRLREMKDFLKSDNKTQIIRDAALGLLPYQPSRIINGSQFDAVLVTQLAFGSEQVPAGVILQLGQTTPEEGVVSANLLTTLDSGKTQTGAPVEAELTGPLFAADHRLLLPEGTRLTGTVSQARPARHFHRNGQLRFSFQQIALPMEIAEMQKRLSQQVAADTDNSRKRIHAGISGLTLRRGSHVGLDDEGAPRVDESKTRFLGPALAVALVAAANSQEQERGQVENRGGAQTAAGASGFALAGAIIGATSHTGALVLGSLGAARSIYSQFLGKGIDIQLPANTALLVQFNRIGTTLPKNVPSDLRAFRSVKCRQSPGTSHAGIQIP